MQTVNPEGFSVTLLKETETGNRPRDTKIRQQTLGGFYTVYDRKETWVDHKFCCKFLAEDISEPQRLGFFIFLPIMIISFLLGIILFEYDTPIIYYKRYDHLTCTNGAPCTLLINVDEDMHAPIYFSYELVNFYQSHRVYLNSKSDDQLRGSVLNGQNCEPSRNLNGKVIYPCGLLPQSIFTDRFFLDVERDGDTRMLCSSIFCPRHESNISWENYWDLFHEDGTWERTGTWGGLSDSKYKTPNEFPSAELYTQNSSFLDGTNLQLPYPDNTDMIVWLHTAVEPTFKKPFRVIKDFDILKGDTVHVNFYHYFNPGEKGEKYFYLETSPGFGPQTRFLGAMCLSIGIFCLCMLAFVMTGIGHKARSY